VDTTKTSEALGRLEYALASVIAAEPAEKTLRQALSAGKITAQTRQQQIEQAREQQILDDSEAELLAVADAARREAIMVDDFSKQELSRNLPQQPTASQQQAPEDLADNNSEATAENRHQSLRAS
jgi:hypothetical protein